MLRAKTLGCLFHLEKCFASNSHECYPKQKKQLHDDIMVLMVDFYKLSSTLEKYQQHQPVILLLRSPKPPFFGLPANLFKVVDREAQAGD